MILLGNSGSQFYLHKHHWDCIPLSYQEKTGVRFCGLLSCLYSSLIPIIPPPIHSSRGAQNKLIHTKLDSSSFPPKKQQRERRCFQHTNSCCMLHTSTNLQVEQKEPQTPHCFVRTVVSRILCCSRSAH